MQAGEVLAAVPAPSQKMCGMPTAVGTDAVWDVKLYHLGPVVSMIVQSVFDVLNFACRV